jgi:hypothetical protein
MSRRARATPARRRREALHQKRERPHPFMAQPNHPDLCLICNARTDDTHRGQFIHPVT